VMIPDFAQKPIEEPSKWLQRWIQEAEKEGEVEPTAMALSTIGGEGRPRTRFVLCKGVSAHGVRFFTNLESAKGVEISVNKHSSIAFHWPKMNRQVRAQGTLEAVPDDEADEYFLTRKRLSRVGAWASKQSRPLKAREDLLSSVKHYSEMFGDDIPRPPHWSGFRLIPDYWEFWQGHDGRLHDRWAIHQSDGNWVSWRLYP